MDYEREINKIKAQLNSLQEAFLQSQRNQVDATSRADSTENKVDAITPFSESMLVGIQDKECVFNDVYKYGTITANVKKDNGEYVPCTIERADNLVRVSFDELDTTATVTISIQ